MFVVVSYDVVDDRRRNKIAKVLKSFGERVQHSVFEMNLDAAELDRMIGKLERHVDKEQDSARIYMLCSACKSRTKIIGYGSVTEPADLIII